MDDNRNSHAMNLRKGRHSTSYGLYLITKCTDAHFLLQDDQRNDVVSAFFHFRNQGDFLIHAFVVMTDHWHILMSLGPCKILAKTVESIGRHSSLNSRRGGRRLSWQREYHDHKLRPFEKVAEMIRYIEGNPVRKGLVDRPDEWIWSSAYPKYQDQLDRNFLGHERWDE